MKNSQQHLGLRPTWLLSHFHSMLYFSWCHLYYEDFWCLLIYKLQSVVCGLQSPVCSLQSAVCGLQSAVCSLQSAVCSLQSANVIHRQKDQQLLFSSQVGPSSRFFHESHDFFTFLPTRLPVSWFLVKYHSEMKCFFVQ